MTKKRSLDFIVTTHSDFNKRYKHRGKTWTKKHEEANAVCMHYPQRIYLFIDDICADTLLEYWIRGWELGKKGFWPHCPQERNPEMKEEDYLEMFISKISGASIHELVHRFLPKVRGSFERSEQAEEALAYYLTFILNAKDENQVEI